jgi:hypothetical protein
VTFDGPIVFCVISRYRGGAFVVFSNALNENTQALAVEGSISSVATRATVRSHELDEVVAEFEAVHIIDQARRVGSVHAIIPAAELRPRIAEAVERGTARTIAAPAGCGKTVSRGAR